MSAFDERDDYKTRLDWKILRDGSIALYWRHAYLNEELEWFREQNYQIYSFNCAEWTSAGMHADFERMFRFPSYYGHNLNALDECLQELSVPEAGGIAIVLNRFDAFSKGPGAPPPPSGRPEAEIVLDILARTSRHFLLTGRRFLTLVQSDDPGIQFAKLGGYSAQWNEREWLDKNRGL
jgi:hypothetical protein